MRLAIGGISHETNTYADACFGLTELDDFDIARGDQIVTRYRDTRTFVGGMLAGADEIGAEVLPTLCAIAQPSGRIAAGAYGAMKAEMLERLQAVLPVDAVALELHGAGVIETIDDLE